MLFRHVTFLIAVAVLVSASDAQAQSLFGGSSGRGGTTGGTSGGVSTTTSRGGISTGGGSLGGGGTAAGRGQAGAGGIAGQNMGTSNFNTGDGSLGQNALNQTFVGRNDNGGFVGNRMAGQTSQQGSQPQFGNLQNNNNRNNQNRNNRSNTDRKPVRPQYRVAFPTPVIPAPQIQSKLVTRIGELPPLQSSVGSVTVTVDNAGQVLLSGFVGTERDKKLVESYIRMEPGVRAISNQLAVREQQ